jgi:hypothetical protein
MPRSVFHVLPVEEGQWAVHRAGDGAMCTCASRAAAIETARQQARHSAPAQVVVFGADGKIELEYRYGFD